MINVWSNILGEKMFSNWAYKKLCEFGILQAPSQQTNGCDLPIEIISKIIDHALASEIAPRSRLDAQNIIKNCTRFALVDKEWRLAALESDSYLNAANVIHDTSPPEKFSFMNIIKAGIQAVQSLDPNTLNNILNYTAGAPPNMMTATFIITLLNQLPAVNANIAINTISKLLP